MPLALLQINTPSFIASIAAGLRWYESHAFFFKQRALPIWPAECKTRRERTVAKNHSMAWDHARLRIGVQRKTNKSRIARIAGECRHLPIGSDFATRNTLYYVIHSGIKGLFHAVIISQQPHPLPGRSRTSALVRQSWI
ncbi:hypothetical protein D2E25_0424 [Bifidobacterium goeldii]|uniref:Uncharacterized protein n=1 Tax=Bifidobacterium goeldii TaxID=2306975 RepID=A0A430FMR1_9BIFI|nr:hypothetical protein D2E25_0424 [Bifidobacterium goeldii]